MSHKKKPYQHFVDTELFQPNSMAYIENLFESYVDGETDIALAEQLSPYVAQATKHRQICNMLRSQTLSTASSGGQVEVLLCDLIL